MAITFEETDYENIRKAIDISMTAASLPDAVIGYDIFAGEAISQIEAATALLSTEQKEAHSAEIKRAAVILTAAFVAPKVPVLTSETLEGDRFTFQNKNLSELSQDLERKAFAIIGRILKQVSAVPTLINTNFPAGLFSTAKANPK